jgi:hypothetical protein
MQVLETEQQTFEPVTIAPATIHRISRILKIALQVLPYGILVVLWMVVTYFAPVS